MSEPNPSVEENSKSEKDILDRFPQGIKAVLKTSWQCYSTHWKSFLFFGVLAATPVILLELFIIIKIQQGRLSSSPYILLQLIDFWYAHIMNALILLSLPVIFNSGTLYPKEIFFSFLRNNFVGISLITLAYFTLFMVSLIIFWTVSLLIPVFFAFPAMFYILKGKKTGIYNSLRWSFLLTLKNYLAILGGIVSIYFITMIPEFFLLVVHTADIFSSISPSLEDGDIEKTMDILEILRDSMFSDFPFMFLYLAVNMILVQPLKSIMSVFLFLSFARILLPDDVKKHFFSPPSS